MIQVEVISSIKEEEFVSDLNYFLENLLEHQLVDIKFDNVLKGKDKILYSALVIYKVE